MIASTHLPTLRAGLRSAVSVVALVALAAAVASCGLAGRPAPVKRMFLLEPTMPHAVANPKPLVLRVGVVNVSASFRGRSLVYRRGELDYEADFYDEFFIPPAQMLSEATANAMSAAKAFKRVSAPGVAAEEGDYVLDGFATELYGDIRDPSKPAAVLAITYYLSSASTRTVVWSGDYRQRVAFIGSDPAALAKAWSTGLSTILAELARDLAAASLPAP